MALLIQLGFVAILMLIGYFWGSLIEKKHYKSLAIREEEFADVLLFSLKTVPPEWQNFRPVLVTGSVVISPDFFKTFVAGIMTLVGGNLSTYETLLERGRREALVRLKKQAKLKGALIVFNVRIEGAAMSQNNNPNAAKTLEMLAYGTGLVKRRSPTAVAPVVSTALDEASIV